MMISCLSWMPFSRWEEEQKTITLRAEAVAKRHSTSQLWNNGDPVEMRQDYIFINITSMKSCHHCFTFEFLTGEMRFFAGRPQKRWIFNVGSSGNCICKPQVFDAPSRWFLERTWWKGQIMARQKHHERVAFETSQKKARSLTIQEAVTAREILLVVI